MGLFSKKQPDPPASSLPAEDDSKQLPELFNNTDELFLDQVEIEDRPPKEEKKVKKYNIKMELLHEGEFERETHKNAKIFEPIDIQTEKSGKVVVHRGKYGINTMYDKEGKIINTLAGGNDNNNIYIDSIAEKDQKFPEGYIKEAEKNKEKYGIRTTIDGKLILDDIDKLLTIFPQAIQPHFLLIFNFCNNIGNYESRFINTFIENYKKFKSEKKIVFIENYDNWTEEQKEILTFKKSNLVKYLVEKKRYPWQEVNNYQSNEWGNTIQSLEDKREDNIIEDVGAEKKISIFDFPSTKKSILYARSSTDNEETRKIYLLDWKREEDISTWELKELNIPEKIKNISGCGLDYKGNFLFLASKDKDKLYVLDYHKTSMEEVGEITNPNGGFHGYIAGLQDGTILAGDKNGNLRKIITNLSEVPSFEEREEQKKQLIRLKSLKRVQRIKKEDRKAGEEAEIFTQELQNISDDITKQFSDDVETAGSLEKIRELKEDAGNLKGEYRKTISNEKLLNQMFGKLKSALDKKEAILLGQYIDEETAKVRSALANFQTMSLTTLGSWVKKIDVLKTQSQNKLIPPEKAKDIANLTDNFTTEIEKIFSQNEEEMIKKVDQLIENEKEKLEKMTKSSEFENWESLDYPAFLDSISIQLKLAPIGLGKFIEQVKTAEEDLRALKKEYSVKFQEQYAKLREKASEKIDLIIDMAVDRLNEFLETFQKEIDKKSFSNKEDAKAWVEGSALYNSVLSAISEVESHDKEKAKELSQILKVRIAEGTYEVKKGKESTIDEETGKQIAWFGDVSFEKWEHETLKKQETKIDLIFKVDEKSKGPGLNPNDYKCELFFAVKDGNEKTHEIPVNKDDYRKFGIYNPDYKEENYFSSYITVAEAQKIRKAVKDMDSKKENELKKRYNEFKTKLRDTSSSKDNLVKDYISFLQDSGVYAWLRLKNFKNSYSNGINNNVKGQGRVPNKPAYLVIDEQTEKYLSAFADNAKLSMELQDGLISLEGHAGTGKDVLIQLFCHETNRPLFMFDASKWTTEFDLSQDVSLSAEGGASFTVKEDSIIVKALSTPGAVLYFNEFNTLPIPAQIFLHSLFDAKRQITLKTSSGRVVKADPSVIICSSSNMGYPDTNTPQFATRSRMIPIKIDYPEFKRTDGTYSSAEALRVARSISSLEDLTIDPDRETNEFIKLWEDYINKGASNSELTPERTFDLEVIFSLLNFGNRLREGFINKVNKKVGRGIFTVSQPFTLREMRRCAYVLSHMDKKQKNDITKAEDLAKDLVRRFYSQYIFDGKEAEDLENQLKQWTTQKPPHP